METFSSGKETDGNASAMTKTASASNSTSRGERFAQMLTTQWRYDSSYANLGLDESSIVCWLFVWKSDMRCKTIQQRIR
jgi:hypothetical protein